VKVKFLTTAADLTANTLATVLSTYALKIESQWFPLVDFMSFMKGLTVGYESGAANAARYAVFINIPCRIQAVSSALDGSAVVAHDELEGHSEVEFKNFASVTVPEFKKGKGYLIPFTAGAVTNMTPNTLAVNPRYRDYVATTLDKMQIVSPFYPYNAAKDEQVRTGTAFTGYIFDVVSEAVNQNLVKTIQSKKVLASNFEKVSM